MKPILPMNSHSIPELPDHFLLSERISKLHHQMSSGQALEISAPAGYGKTTLVASYLKHFRNEANQACWNRLSKKDAHNPAFFSSRLLSMLHFLLKDCIMEEKTSLKQKLNKGFDKEAFLDLLTLAWENYAKRPHKGLCLALDECEHLAANSEAQAILTYILDKFPPNINLLLMSRVPLEIFTEKQKLDKRCLKITMADLAFSPNEIKKLFELINPGNSVIFMAEKLADLCEGWIAPVLIMAQALMEKEKAGRLEKYDIQSATLNKHNATGKIGPHKLAAEMEQAPESLMETGSSLFNYIEGEIIKDLNQEDLEQLASLGLLKTFSAPLADAIFRINNLEEFFNRNKQIALLAYEIPGYTGYFRFQSILKSYLIKSASKIFGREQLDKLHYNTASYFINEGSYLQAAEHIAHCPTYPKTLELVTTVGIKFMIVGESGHLKKWLDLLPKQVLMINPVLLVFKALLMPHSSYREAEQLLLKAYTLANKEGNLLLQYRAATSLVFIYYISGNMAGIVKITTRAKNVLKRSGEPFKGSFSLLKLMNATGKSAFFKGFKEAEQQDITILPEEDRWLHLGYYSLAASYLGSPLDAEEAMQQALSLASVEKTEAAKATALYLLSTAFFLQDKREELLNSLEPLKEISEKYQFSFFLASFKLYSGYLRYYAFDHPGALHLLDEAGSLYRNCGNLAMALLAKLHKLLWTDATAQKEFILARANWVVEKIGRLNAGNLVEEIALSIHGAINLNNGNIELAETSLLLSTKKARAKKAKQVMAGNFFYLARLYYTTGKKDQGKEKLKEALKLSQEGDYTIFWAIHLPTITEMAIRALNENFYQKHASKILTAFFGKENTRYLEQKSKTLPGEEICSFSTRFLVEAEENPNKKLFVVQARLFGRVEISINGEPIPDGAWKTRKNRGIIEYLLLNCGKSINKETLIDLFWPDADSRAAHTSFRTALYMLRKLFDAYGLELKGSGSFIMETTGGLMIKHDDSIDLDYSRFITYFEELETLSPLNTITRLEMLEKAVLLYRGELLEGKDYGDLLYFEQERCKSLFENACLELGTLYIKHGKPLLAESVLKKVLKSDPYSEDAFRALLKLYRKENKITQARKLINSFKKRLKDELDLDLDSSFEELFIQ